MRSLFLLRRFNEGDTYGRPFGELVNLCAINRWILEVNSSRKLDPKSPIDRSLSVECTTEFTYLDKCSLRPSQSAFLYKGTILRFCLLIVALILLLTNTAS